jgi:uncharacterized protein
MNQRRVNCPRCGVSTLFAPDNPFRPFCSRRCKLIDIGAWASEQYRIASPANADARDSADAGDLPSE